jgi:uncharacterized membrane protein
MARARAGKTLYYSISRVEAYTDGVFAIAATLLVLDLTTKTFGTIRTDADMWAALGGMWETFTAFAISFGLLTGIWVLHLRQFRDIARADLTLLWLNSARLLFVVLIPFTTTLVDEYSEFTAGRILLPINFFLAVVFGVATYSWAAARGGHLLTEEAKADAAAERLGSIVAIVCGAVTIVLSPWIGSWAFASYAFSGPLTAVLTRRRKQSGTSAPSAG